MALSTPRIHYDVQPLYFLFFSLSLPRERKRENYSRRCVYIFFKNNSTTSQLMVQNTMLIQSNKHRRLPGQKRKKCDLHKRGYLIHVLQTVRTTFNYYNWLLLDFVSVLIDISFRLPIRDGSCKTVRSEVLIRRTMTGILEVCSAHLSLLNVLSNIYMSLWEYIMSLKF